MSSHPECIHGEPRDTPRALVHNGTFCVRTRQPTQIQLTFAMTEPLVLDDEVLAALDFIDAFDAFEDLDEPTELEPSPRASRTCVKRPRIHSSQRSRAEIQRLRKLVSELDARLQQLQRTRSQVETVDMAHTLQLRRWEEIASRQKTERLRAETENRRLRGLLDKQSRVVRQLENLLTHGGLDHETHTIARLLVGENADDARPAQVSRSLWDLL